jgi:hypothetical protein
MLVRVVVEPGKRATDVDRKESTTEQEEMNNAINQARLAFPLLIHEDIDQVGKVLVNGLQSSNSHARSEFELPQPLHLCSHTS